MLGRRRSFLAAAKDAILPVAATLWTALGTFWTIFAWYHQEIVVPSTAPVNLTTEIALENVGSSKRTSAHPAEQFEAIQLTVTAANVSGKSVYMLANYWDAAGGKVELQSNIGNNEAWLRDINEQEQLQAQTGQFRYSMSGKYYKISRVERVAWGNVFPSTYFLYPKETVSASVIFYVPKGSYDLVHVEVHIPTTKDRNSVQMSFLVDQERVKPKYFKIDTNGIQQEIAETDIPPGLVQETQSRKQLALWRNDASAKPTSPAAPSP
jgi:hypothetical protein